VYIYIYLEKVGYCEPNAGTVMYRLGFRDEADWKWTTVLGSTTIGVKIRWLGGGGGGNVRQLERGRYTSVGGVDRRGTKLPDIIVSIA